MNKERIKAAYDGMGDTTAAMDRVWARLRAEAETLDQDVKKRGTKPVPIVKLRRTWPVAAAVATALIAAVYAIGFFGVYAQLRTDRMDSVDTPESIAALTQPPAVADEWGLVDEDGDGIIVDEVKGEGYLGYMMVVLDPSRVILGCVPEDFGSQGYSVEEMVQRFDAVAGVNAGGVKNARYPSSIPGNTLAFKGDIYYGEAGIGMDFVGLDDKYKLRVDLTSTEEIEEANIQYGCSFGPVLVADGEDLDLESLDSGVNARTAIGQRSDGAILLLVIDGRQVNSMGATFQDLSEIMLRYGAVNACNLCGGVYPNMYYDGEYINNNDLNYRDLPMPTTFLVLKEGARESGGY